MTSNLTKDQIINYGIKAGYKGSDINKVLNAAGYSNYNPLTAQANWENLPSNLKRGAKEFARDMRTMGGVIAQPFVDVRDAKPGDKLAKAKESFIKAVNNVEEGGTIKLFNDIVFDAYITWGWNGSAIVQEAVISVKAAGGTLPIYIGGVEIHEAMGVASNMTWAEFSARQTVRMSRNHAP